MHIAPHGSVPRKLDVRSPVKRGNNRSLILHTVAVVFGTWAPMLALHAGRFLYRAHAPSRRQPAVRREDTIFGIALASLALLLATVLVTLSRDRRAPWAM